MIINKKIFSACTLTVTFSVFGFGEYQPEQYEIRGDSQTSHSSLTLPSIGTVGVCATAGGVIFLAVRKGKIEQAVKAVRNLTEIIDHKVTSIRAEQIQHGKRLYAIHKDTSAIKTDVASIQAQLSEHTKLLEQIQRNTEMARQNAPLTPPAPKKSIFWF